MIHVTSDGKTVELSADDWKRFSEQSDRLSLALMRAAGAIQSMHIGHGYKGVNGEAVLARATVIQNHGEAWDAACDRARAELQPRQE